VATLLLKSEQPTAILDFLFTLINYNDMNGGVDMFALKWLLFYDQKKEKMIRLAFVSRKPLIQLYSQTNYTSMSSSAKGYEGQRVYWSREVCSSNVVQQPNLTKYCKWLTTASTSTSFFLGVTSSGDIVPSPDQPYWSPRRKVTNGQKFVDFF